jgi:hypothetical protein
VALSSAEPQAVTVDYHHFKDMETNWRGVNLFEMRDKGDWTVPTFFRPDDLGLAKLLQPWIVAVLLIQALPGFIVALR